MDTDDGLRKTTLKAVKNLRSGPVTSAPIAAKEDFDWLNAEMTGFIRTQLIAAAATLRLAEHLQDGGRPAEDFATVAGREPAMAFRFLCAKRSAWSIARTRIFHATSRLRGLHAETPGSLRHKAMAFGTPSQFLLQSAFLPALRSPEARDANGLGTSLFDYYANHPDEAAIFRATMQCGTVGVTEEIARSLDTSSSALAVDVGGADGALLHSLMQHNPQLRGIVLDRPEAAVAATAAAKERGVADRAEAVAGDFFETLPEGDLYLLRFILHDWADAKAIRILENCRRAMKPSARVVVVEAFLPEVGEDVPRTMHDTQVPLIDMAIYTWIVPHENQGQKLGDFPHLKRWFEVVSARPATQRAYARAKEINTNPNLIDEESRKILFGQTAANVR